MMLSDKTVLFLTAPNDPLAREFAVQSSTHGLSFFFVRDAVADWCIAWVADDNGHVQAWLEHIPSGQDHWLGEDPQEAIRSACRLIREWDGLEARDAILAVQ
jgi:hypothetical protein